MLEEVQEREDIVERVAALDIGKAELVCCVRVPGRSGSHPTGSGGEDLQDHDQGIVDHGRPAHRVGGDAGGDGGDE